MVVGGGVRHGDRQVGRSSPTQVGFGGEGFDANLKPLEEDSEFEKENPSCLMILRVTCKCVVHDYDMYINKKLHVLIIFRYWCRKVFLKFLKF